MFAMTNGDTVAIGLDLGMTRRQHVKQVCTSEGLWGSAQK